MVSETLNRRQLHAERLQRVQEQQESLERLRSQQLPDGRTLGETDQDGSLFEALQALMPVVRKHEQFKLDLTTAEGLCVRVANVEGALDVEVQEEETASPAGAAVDVREKELDVRRPALDVRESALSALLRRQAQDGA